MKSILKIAAGFLLLMGQQVLAQPNNPVADRVRNAQNKGKAIAAPGLLKRLGDPDPAMQKVLKRGSLMSLDRTLLRELKRTRPDFLELQLPMDGGETLTVQLVKNEVHTPDFRVSTSNPVAERYDASQSLFYQGIVKGPARSIAAISVYGDELMGVIDLDGFGNMILGPLDNDPQSRYTLFRSQDLMHDMKLDCGTEKLGQSPVVEVADQITLMAEDPNKCVRIYFECEYDMFVSRGSSVQSTIDYMTGIYNVVKTLYDNENIRTAISEIFVWTTPDSYPTTSTSDALYAFRSARGTSFNGDVAHLVSRGAPSGGGIAFLDVACTKSYAFAYSFINSSYAQFPTYSWTVMVIAHEMGHNLGSPHTHNCSWDVNGDGIASEMVDGCGPSAGYSEGSCPVAPLPTGGGTIMSYCHLTSAGINFNNGFGLLPGNRIRNRVYNASCLTACSTCNTQVSTASTPVSCPGANDGSATATGIGGTPPYTYLWSTGATTASISGLAAGSYTVTVRDQGGNGCAQSATVVVSGPAAFNVTSVITPEAVPGANNGSIDITVSGGTAPYTYTWSNGSTSQDLVNISGGNYTVTIRDSRNCTTQRTFTVGSNGCGQQLTGFPVNEGFETGLGIFTQATYDNFDWTRQSGTTPNNRTGPAGAYQGSWYLYAQGKGNTGNAAIESPCLDLRNLTNPQVSFFYSMNGSQIGTLRLEVSTNNGANWTTLWSLSGNQGTAWLPATVSLNSYKTAFTKIRFFSIAGGNFGDIAIDAINISGQTTNPCVAPTLAFSKTDVSCFGGSNGTATVTPSGGTAPYTYAWSNQATSATISNLAAGVYSVTVTATGGCTATGQVTVGSPAPLQLSAQPTNTSAPGASDGAVVLSVSGGTPAYTYAWSNNAQSKDLTNVPAGTYTVTVTDSRGCTAQTSATVNDPVVQNCLNGITLPYSESFESGLGQWTQRTDDNFDWRLNSGGTPTANTGPTAAAQGSVYLYTEANDASAGARAVIESACVDLTNAGNATFSFAWHMFGNQMGNLALHISEDQGNTWSTLWTRSGNFGTSWVTEQINLVAYAGKIVRFRFTGTLSNGVRGDMAIDNISITNAAPTRGLITLQGPAFEWKSVFPNPAKGSVQLELYAPNAVMANISLVDVAGRHTDLGRLSLSQGANNLRVNLPVNASGLYLLRLQENGNTHTKPVMVMK